MDVIEDILLTTFGRTEDSVKDFAKDALDFRM